MAGRGISALGMLFLMMSMSTAWAGEADVVKAAIRKMATGDYQIEATLKHADTGWDHYADRWEALSPEGKILATRVLAHPHVDEQPFTRSLSGIKLPTDVETITIRAHDSVHGYGGTTQSIPVPGN